MISRRNLFAAAAALAPAAMAQSPRPGRRPNVIFILADDLGFTDLGHRGGPMKTPHLDRLAREGVRLERHYTYPLCSPTRSGLMTGRNPMRLGLGYTVVRPWESRGLPLEETTMAEVFRAGGYRTAIAGKWHLGHHSAKQLPQARGFDHFYGHVNGAIGYFAHDRDGGVDWQRDGVTVREEGYTTDLLAKEAIRWIGPSPAAAKPFFLYLPFNAPHGPLEAPAEALARHAAIADPKRRAYVAMVEEMDTAVGRIRAHLEKTGEWENTIVGFQSDNGGPVNVGADNGPLRGGKASVWEGGLRVPAFVSAPGRLKSGQTEAVTMVCDWLPTLAAAAGIPARTRLPLDGANLWPQLARGASAPERQDLFFAVEPGTGGPQLAVLAGPWKLIRMGGKEQLYNVFADPREQQDRLAAEPAIAARLRLRLDAWEALAPAGSLRHSNNAPAGFQAPAEWTALAR
jgi:arylsulfatase A-like enzyme